MIYLFSNLCFIQKNLLTDRRALINRLKMIKVEYVKYERTSKELLEGIFIDTK